LFSRIKLISSIFFQVYLRGSQIRFVIVPDMFKNAPMFKRVKAQAKNRNTAMMRQKAQKARGNTFINHDYIFILLLETFAKIICSFEAQILASGKGKPPVVTK
jgi:hypothetical protein